MFAAKGMSRFIALLFGVMLWCGLARADIDEYAITAYEAENPQALLVWLSGDRGTSEGEQAVLKRLIHYGVSGYYLDPLQSWFLPISTYAANDVPSDELAQALLDVQALHPNVPLFVYARGRMTEVLLEAVALAQQQGQTISGVLLNSALVFAETPEVGSKPEFAKIATNTNAPIYLFQAQYSYAYWFLKDTAAALEKSGSNVFTRYYPNVRGGFVARSEEVTEQDLALRNQFHMHIIQAMKHLKPLAHKHRGVKHAQVSDKSNRRKNRRITLTPMRGAPPAYPLKLETLSGSPFDLSKLKGKAALVNFWASWCPPCIHEIPALNRMMAQLEDENIELVTVNMGEDASIITPFIKQYPINGRILLDIHGEALKEWQVYAFPTSFLVHPKGHITHAVFGAIDWDSAENVQIIRDAIR